MTNIDAATIERAIIAWTGYGEAAYPTRSDGRVARDLGNAVAACVMPRVRDLEDDFYRSPACRTAESLSQMGELASAEFAAKHPEISAEAVEALAWCYTFDHK